MTDEKYSALFSGMNLPHEMGFRTFHGTDCGWSTCCRNSTHFHCRTCGYGTSQAANIISHRRICISYKDLPPKEFSRLAPSAESGIMQHEVLQPAQSYSYYSAVGPSVTLPSQSNSLVGANSKLISTQQSAMFNFVIPAQNSQYSALYGTQTVFPNSNLFSPSSYNSFGQMDTPWLPQPRLMSSSVHSSNSTSDLLGNVKSPFEKLDSTNSSPCCGRISSIETATIGMCSPLTAEAYKVVSKEFQTKLDTQNWYCSPQGVVGFNSQLPPCKFAESVPPCSVSLLVMEQTDSKQGQECIGAEDLCFETTKNDVKTDLVKENTNQSFRSCLEQHKEDIEVLCSKPGEKKNQMQPLNLNHIEEENIELGSISVSEESDIIVEDSDFENGDSGSIAVDVKPALHLKCLVCNNPPPLHSVNDFIKITTEKPVTTTSQVSALIKLSQVVDDEKFNKLKDCLICPRCLNLINLIDNLEIKLSSAKKELVNIYKLKDSEEETIKNCDEDNLSKKPPKKTFECEMCSKKFSSVNYLEKHKQCHTKEFSYYCEYCGKGFAVLQTLQNHIMLHSNTSRYQCELCGKRFVQKDNLINHIKKHKGEYKYQCTECKKGFIRRSVFKAHKLIHNSESLMCQHCGKQFKSLGNLSIHIKICSGDLKFSCSKCEKKFPIRSLLKRHVSLSHNSEYQFICNICKKGFGKKSDLITHLRTHSDSKPFKCTKCSNCYKSLSNLNQHLKVHSSDAVLECSVCKKKFTRQDCYNDHLNQHSGNKPYKCTTCWKTFANRINFNIHMKRHNGTLKKTPCPVCGKLFNKGLKDHLTSHSGEKPYSCKECSAVFTVKSSLNKHLKSKHNAL